MSDERDNGLRRTVGDMEIARIRALAHEKPGDKVIDHRNYLDLPPGSGTSVHTRVSRAGFWGKIRRFLPWL